MSYDSQASRSLDVRRSRSAFVLRWLVYGVVLAGVLVLPPVLAVSWRREPADFTNLIQLGGLVLAAGVIVLVPLAALAVSRLPTRRATFSEPVLRVGPDGLTLRRNVVPPGAAVTDEAPGKAPDDVTDDASADAGDAGGSDVDDAAAEGRITEARTAEGGTAEGGTAEGPTVEHPAPRDTGEPGVLELPHEPGQPGDSTDTSTDAGDTSDATNSSDITAAGDPFEIPVAWDDVTAIRVLRGLGRTRLAVTPRDTDAALARFAGEERRTAAWTARIHGAAYVVDITGPTVPPAQIFDAVTTCSQGRFPLAARPPGRWRRAVRQAFAPGAR